MTKRWRVFIIKNIKIVSIIFVTMFSIMMTIPISGGSSRIITSGMQNQNWISENAPSNSTFIDAIQDDTNIRVPDDGQAFDGLNLISLGVYPNYTESRDRGEYLIVADNSGNIVTGLWVPGNQGGSPQFINSTTVLHSNRDYEGILLWNMVTNVTEELNIPTGHHDIEYNAISDTFMIIESVYPEEFEFEGDMMDVKYDDLVQFDRDGNELWRWHGNSTFPFDAEEFYLRNETRRGDLDWMHSNALYWDIDDGSIYLSVRHLDCIVKVDFETGETVWVAGRYSGNHTLMDLYNKNGEQVDSLFYHTHAIELIGPDRFIVYDNDYKNLTRDNIDIGITRFVEFSVDGDANTATEIWSYTNPPSYYAHSQGDANRLPNGNTIGAHNNPPEPIIVEVNQQEEIVFEWVFNLTDDQVGFRIAPNGIEKFLEEPLVEVGDYLEVISEGMNATINFSAWDTFQRRHTSVVNIRVLEGAVELTEVDLAFLPHWQETLLSVDVPGLAVGSHNLTIEVENCDGITTSFGVTIDVTSNLPLYLGIAGAGIVAVVLIIYFVKKK